MKKFFEKKKMDYRFAKAGTGHSLAGASSGSHPPPQQQATPTERQHPSQASQLAGTAALSRFEEKSGSGACKPKLKNTTGNICTSQTLSWEMYLLHFISIVIARLLLP